MSRSTLDKCIKKTGNRCVFDTREEAQREANRLAGRGGNRVRYSPYLCGQCKKFHVGKPYLFEKSLVERAREMSARMPLEKVLVCKKRRCGYQHPPDAVQCFKCGGPLKETLGFNIHGVRQMTH